MRVKLSFFYALGLKPNEMQTALVAASRAHSNVAYVAPRMSGTTTAFSLMALYDAMFLNRTTVIYVAASSLNYRVLDTVLRAYDFVEEMGFAAITSATRTHLTFQGGGSVRVTNLSNARGHYADTVFLDNADLIPDTDDHWNALSTAARSTARTVIGGTWSTQILKRALYSSMFFKLRVAPSD